MQFEAKNTAKGDVKDMDKDMRKEFKRKLHFPARKNRLTDFKTQDEIPTDVLGSYTGSPEDDGEPTQDADDL